MAKRPQKAKSKRIRKARPGPDGRTLGERLAMAMGAGSPPLTEKALLQRCWEICGEAPDVVKHLVSQQNINEVLRNIQSTSAFTPIFAEACGARAVWLQFGLGDPGFVPMGDAATRGTVSTRLPFSAEMREQLGQLDSTTIYRLEEHISGWIQGRIDRSKTERDAAKPKSGAS